MSGDLKDWTRDEMIDHATWIVIQATIRGNLREGVHEAIILALRWKGLRNE